MNELSHEKIKEFIAFSKNTLKEAGDILIKYKNKVSIKKVKDTIGLDIATNADYAVETYLVKSINIAYPDHDILTEETLSKDTHSDFQWIIDPLDGTKEYLRHTPYYYSLMALRYKNMIVCGSGYQPDLKRMFTGGLGIKTRINGFTFECSNEVRLEKSHISVGLPNKTMKAHDIGIYLDFLKKLTFQCYRLRNNTWDVEALFNVSTGIVEGYILPPYTGLTSGPKMWDIAPGIALINGSKGMITDFYGESLNLKDMSRGIVATNGLIHNDLLNLIKTYYL